MLGVVGRIRKSESKGWPSSRFDTTQLLDNIFGLRRLVLGVFGRIYNGIMIMTIEQWCLDGILRREACRLTGVEMTRDFGRLGESLMNSITKLPPPPRNETQHVDHKTNVFVN